VRDVLAYSKVAKQEIKLEQVDLDVFVPGLIGQMPELQRSDLTVTIRQPLPVVFGHQAYLSQIFTNLVGNSIKFARPDVPPVVEIAAQIEGRLATITVRDNGIGIDPEHFSRIFEIFGRIYPDKKFEGTGIGLAIVKKAVQRMGGSLGVESTLGNGATFWFTLTIP
jgi:signal transduction histidine kinase